MVTILTASGHAPCIARHRRLPPARGAARIPAPPSPPKRPQRRAPIAVTDTPRILLVLTTLPDADQADQMAARLVGEGLAACVNRLAPCRSHYQWQGRLECAEEVPLLIKTTAERYPALEQALRAAHPYELPEIIAVPVERGLPDYLAWVATASLPAQG